VWVNSLVRFAAVFALGGDRQSGIIAGRR
jgi:hypothetical protein